MANKKKSTPPTNNNIFKSDDAETLKQRNPLLDLGIKQDPEAVTKYPWAIQKESTDEAHLKAEKNMLYCDL